MDMFEHEDAYTTFPATTLGDKWAYRLKDGTYNVYLCLFRPDLDIDKPWSCMWMRHADDANVGPYEFVGDGWHSQCFAEKTAADRFVRYMMLHDAKWEMGITKGEAMRLIPKRVIETLSHHGLRITGCNFDDPDLHPEDWTLIYDIAGFDNLPEDSNLFEILDDVYIYFEGHQDWKSAISSIDSWITGFEGQINSADDEYPKDNTIEYFNMTIREAFDSYNADVAYLEKAKATAAAIIEELRQ
jgi:hypothetical protein